MTAPDFEHRLDQFLFQPFAAAVAKTQPYPGFIKSFYRIFKRKKKATILAAVPKLLLILHLSTWQIGNSITTSLATCVYILVQFEILKELIIADLTPGNSHPNRRQALSETERSNVCDGNSMTAH